MEKEKEYVILRTYETVWNFERKIHSFEGLKLLIPVSINDALYFGVGLGITLIFTKIIPFFGRINWVIRFGVIPFGIMKYLTKQKLDGKYPHKFFFDFLVYNFSPKKYYKFREIKDYKGIVFDPVVMRDTLILDKTELAVKNIRDSKKRKK